jgi:membrane protease YdiL (CAAX protease family)
VIAWVAILLASHLSLIVWQILLRQNDIPRWEPAARLVGLVAILILSRAFPALRPLGGYVLALIAYVVGNLIRDVVENVPIWIAWAQSSPEYQRIFADAIIALLPGLLMVLICIGSGFGRRELFLVKGDVSAPSALALSSRLNSWSQLGLIFAVVFAAPLAFQLFFTVRPDFQMVGKLVPAMPIILAFAVINAVSEELRFRSVLLARLETVLGGGQALWITAVLFGLAHWSGHPSGPTGVVLTGFGGWVLGKSMLETRGSLWAWLIHGFQDVVVLAFIVMTSN